MNAEMFVQEQISDRRGYFRVDILTFQCQSNCKEKNRDARLVALSFWFAFTGVKRPSAFRPYMEHDPPSGRRHSRLSTRDALFREIEGCTSQHYHFDTLPGEQISYFFAPYSSRIESVSICVPFRCSS